MRRIIGIGLVMAFVMNILSVTTYAGNYTEGLYLEYNANIYRYSGRLVTVEINKNIVETGDMPAVIIDKRTLVPVREVFESEAFGATVTWNGDRRQVSISYEDKLIILEIDKKIALVNGAAVELDVPPMLIRDISKEYAKTMIPLRFVSESLDFIVDWNSDSYTAMLDNGKVTDQPATEDPIQEEATEDPIQEEATEDPIQEEAIEETVVERPVSGKTAEAEGATDIVPGDKLDGLTGAGANKELPTALKNDPVQWSATSEQLAELDETYIETTITAEEHSETKIRNVKYEDDGAFKQFIIEASSAISDVDYFVWDGKFIMDISNSINDLEAEEPFEDNPILTSIRASQYSVAPNATRIVFDLIDSGNKFDLSFSEDRRNIKVRVTENSIHNIHLGQNAMGDFIQVTGVAAPDVKMFRLSAPDRIVIDFPNTQTLIGFNESIAAGQYVEKIRTAQFDATTTRIVVETNGQADYEIAKADGGQTVIQFTEPGYKNIEYVNIDNPTIALNQEEVDINIDGIIYKNDYMNRTYTIVSSENYGNLFGDGSLKVNDGIIETVDISETDEGLTKITIESTTVHEYRIEETNNKIFIRAYKPRELYDRIVVVDTGHGGKDPGAVANGLHEKTVNLTITTYLKSFMDADERLQVYYTRLTDTYPTLQERCDLANEVEADFFLSIHNNAYYKSETGTETLYFPSDATGKLTSPSLAKIFQNQLVEVLGSYDRGTKQRENLFVLRHTAMPAIIVEVGFLTNAEDSVKLKESSYLAQSAMALYRAALEVFEEYPTRR